MICKKCGKENPEGNAVCFLCGEPLTGTATEDQVTAEQVVAAVQAQTTAQPAGQPSAGAQTTAQPGQVGATAATAAPSYTTAQAQTTTTTPTASTAPAAPAQTVYAKGCIGCAWDDIKQSDGWVSRTLLLGLVNLVPILNWFVTGYCMRWARQLPMGRIESMPKQIFVNRGFINGAFYFVLALVVSLVSGVVGGIIGWVPILGWLAAIAVSVFMCMFLNVAVMRTALADRLGAGFDIGAIWQTLKKNPGSLLCITIVPGIIIGIVIGVIAFIIFAIAGVAMSGNIYDLIMLSNYYDGYAPYGYSGHHSGYGYGGDVSSLSAFMALMGIFTAMAPAFLLVYVIACFAGAFQSLLVYRALGHWTARFASEWMSDPTVTSTMNLYPDPQPAQPMHP